jgi:MtaA/CmuA family methyltransferase
MNSKERCLAAIKGQTPDRIPVFPLLMSFSSTRNNISYREFSTNGYAMAESQVKIYERFGVDAITACSDAFRITADLGAEMAYPDTKPPYALAPLVRTEADFKKLSKPDVNDPKGRMADRTLGTKEMVKAVGDECLVLGWVDMPFAEACSICGVSEFMMMIYENPSLAHNILDFLTGIVIEFSLAQLAAGAPMIGAGDAAASLISGDLFKEFALAYEKRVCQAIHNAGGLMKLHICGNTSHLLQNIVDLRPDLVNVDHLVSLTDARDAYGRAGICFKGNINPVSGILQSTPEKCFMKASECIQITRGYPYMLSAGCEIPAETSDDIFTAFCNAPKASQ